MRLASLDLAGLVVGRELGEIIETGFLMLDGCVFLKSLHGLSVGVAASNFPDSVGYECFVNSIHVEDYVLLGHVSQAILFVSEVFAAWRNFSNADGGLAAIVLVDGFGVVVKFHLAREGESWLASDLEKYEEAVLFILSSNGSVETQLGLAEMWQPPDDKT